MKKQYCLLTIIIALFGVLNTNTALCQNGGMGAYQFLNTTYNARSAALGSDFLSVYDNDITLTTYNPSLISSEVNNSIGLNYVNFFDGINFGVAQYGRSFEKVGTFVGSIQYFNYGKFTYADESGTKAGEFNANDFAFTLGWGRELTDNFTIGANLKWFYSSYESYKSNGIAADVAATFHSDESKWAVSLIGRNIGTQIKPFHDGEYESLPFKLQLGVSKGFLHIPVRLFINLDDLQKWDLTYNDPEEEAENIDAFTGEKKSDSEAEEFFKNAVRHIIIGGELAIAKRLYVRMSYNFKRSNELSIKERSGTVGFSWGLGLRLNRFNISYSRSAYHLYGSPNYFTISTNLGNFK
ncbi:MAG: type IX secretion system protein PorQ [Hyphomicrobiales bacterium]